MARLFRFLDALKNRQFFRDYPPLDFLQGRCQPGNAFRPRLEILETRTLLSDWTVSLLTDTGEKGDLRFCITQSQYGDRITVQVTGTINLTHVLPGLTHKSLIAFS